MACFGADPFSRALQCYPCVAEQFGQFLGVVPQELAENGQRILIRGLRFSPLFLTSKDLCQAEQGNGGGWIITPELLPLRLDRLPVGRLCPSQLAFAAKRYCRADQSVRCIGARRPQQLFRFFS